MRVFCGIDWASDHHDAALVDADGKHLVRARIGDDVVGLQQLLDLLRNSASHNSNSASPREVRHAYNSDRRRDTSANASRRMP